MSPPDAIAQLLTRMGAHDALMVWEERRMRKEVRATANRLNLPPGRLRHREHPVEGVQFHPESILTQHGHALLKNFLER